MSANADVLYEKLKALPPQRRAEVEEFVDFLARRETRTAALDRLLAIAPALEAAGEPRMTEAAIAAEIKAYRAEKRARAPHDPKAKGRT
jgi:hypothetical protein